MDPTISQTPTPTPAPAPTPVTPSMPVMNPAPSAEPVAPVTPAVSAMPQMNIPEPVAPVVNPATVATPNIDTTASPATNTGALVGPAVVGDATASPVSATPVVSTVPVVSSETVGASGADSSANLPEASDLPDLAGIVQEVTMSANSSTASLSDANAPQPLSFGNSGSGLADTAPLTMPDAPVAPDPVEEELKAPLKPADPVSGSIGSSISGPALNTPSVAFNDPANANMMANANTPAKKRGKKFGGKMDKTTLILLCVVGGMVVVALIVVLVMQFL